MNLMPDSVLNHRFLSIGAGVAVWGDDPYAYGFRLI